MKFHHIGVASKDGAAVVKNFQNLGALFDGKVFSDPTPGVYIRFVNLGDVRYEIVSPMDENSAVWPFLKRRISFYHVCYETNNFDDHISEWTQKGCHLISGPFNAVAFENRRVAFLLLTSGEIIEFLES